MLKEQFIEFVKKHKELVTLVINNKTTWQKLYDIYKIYGEDKEIWNDYIINKKNISTFKELIDNLGKIDLENIEEKIKNLEKTIKIIKDIGLVNEKDEKIYEERPMYEHFED